MTVRLLRTFLPLDFYTQSSSAEALRVVELIIWTVLKTHDLVGEKTPAMIKISTCSVNELLP